MTEAQGWALTALGALLVLAAFLVLVGRTTIQQANAFSVLEKMDQRMDERIRIVTSRIESALRKRGELPNEDAPEGSRRSGEDTERSPFAETPGLAERGGSGLLIEEQPEGDDLLETVG